MKIVINSCFGGFSLSKEAQKELGENRNIERTDSALIALIESWGSEKVSGRCAELRIIEIPDDISYTIQDYDGMEHVAEAHRTWY